MEPNPSTSTRLNDRPTSAWWRVALGLVPLVALFVASRYNYLLFHTVAEVFAIVIACGTFMVAWNARHFLSNGYLMLVGISALFVATFDLAHTMAYKGMPILATASANTATQLWISGRLVETVSLLVAPLLLRRGCRPSVLVGVYGLVTSVLLMSIFTWKVFPDCFVEGKGLTVFKVGAEYTMCVMLLGAIGLLWQHRAYFEEHVLRWLIVSMAITIAAELAFTLYTDVYGVANLLGHYFKIVAYYFLYKALVETGFARPFALLLRENRLREQHLEAAKEQLDKANAELETRVAERTASLQEATDDLNAFVYSVAHDLRAPSRAQYGFGSLLLESQRDKLPPDGVQCVEKIMQAALRMDALVSNLLGYVSVCRETPVVKPLELADAVAEVLAEFAEPIQRTHAVIHAQHARGTVLACQASLRRALRHLLDNALKFAKPGQPPEISFRTELREQWVRLWVEDNGIGIAPKYHDKLFGVFQRLHGDGAYAGMGMGLALVKRSIQRIGGRVGVESEAGQGCRFWIELQKTPE